MLSKAKNLIALALALALCGCSSSATLTAGASLGKAGQLAATQMEQNATISSATMLNLRKAVAFNDGFNNAIGNGGSQEFLANEAAIQVNLAQYAKMLDSLAVTYGALGDLATYDASGSFNTAFSAFAADATKFGQVFQSDFSVPSVVTPGVQAVGGVVIAMVQAGDVKAASRNIRAVLAAIIPIMDNITTRELLVMNKQEVTGQITQAGVVLFGSGVYSYGPVLDDLGAAMSLKSNAQSDRAVAKNPKLLMGLRNVAIEQANQQSDQMAASYDKSVDALKALVPLHKSLENGAPLNLDTVLADINQLQTIATALQTAKGK